MTVPVAHPASCTFGYRVWPRGKATGTWRSPPTPSSADVKEKSYIATPPVDLHGSSRVNFTFTFILESKINFGEEADELVGEFTASSYRLATSKIALWNFNKDLFVLRRLLMHEQRVRNVISISSCGVNEVV